MENNDQTNYDIGLLLEELTRIFELIEKFRDENEELLKTPDFDFKDYKIYSNLLTRMKLINMELKSLKEKIPPFFEMVAVYPNFPKSGAFDEKKANEKCHLIATQLFSTNYDSIINEMILSMDETIDNTPEALKKLKDYQNFQNKLIGKILG